MSSPQTQAQPQTPDARKVGSDGEDFSDTVNEITNFEVNNQIFAIHFQIQPENEIFGHPSEIFIENHFRKLAG